MESRFHDMISLRIMEISSKNYSEEKKEEKLKMVDTTSRFVNFDIMQFCYQSILMFIVYFMGKILGLNTIVSVIGCSGNSLITLLTPLLQNIKVKGQYLNEDSK